MAITSSGWIDFWPALANTVKGVFEKNQEDIIEQADVDPSVVLPVSLEDQTTVLEAYDLAVDETIEKTVNDINSEMGGDTNEIPQEQISNAKLIGGFFILQVLSRSYERLHSAKIARQAQGDEETQSEALESAVNTSNNQIDTVTRNELGMTYADAARVQFEARGQSDFIWIHSGSDHPRQDHLAANGNVYQWSEGAPVEGTYPGVAYNCACYAAANEPENQ